MPTQPNPKLWSIVPDALSITGQESIPIIQNGKWRRIKSKSYAQVRNSVIQILDPGGSVIKDAINTDILISILDNYGAFKESSKYIGVTEETQFYLDIGINKVSLNRSTIEVITSDNTYIFEIKITETLPYGGNDNPHTYLLTQNYIDTGQSIQALRVWRKLLDSNLIQIGTWTPTGIVSMSYVSNIEGCIYQVIGNRCFISGKFTLAPYISDSNFLSVSIAGLPRTPKSKQFFSSNGNELIAEAYVNTNGRLTFSKSLISSNLLTVNFSASYEF